MADKNNEREEKTVVVAKNAAELQKIRLEKLMNNPVKYRNINSAFKFRIFIRICFELESNLSSKIPFSHNSGTPGNCNYVLTLKYVKT